MTPSSRLWQFRCLTPVPDNHCDRSSSLSSPAPLPPLPDTSRVDLTRCNGAARHRMNPGTCITIISQLFVDSVVARTCVVLLPCVKWIVLDEIPFQVSFLSRGLLMCQNVKTLPFPLWFTPNILSEHFQQFIIALTLSELRIRGVIWLKLWIRGLFYTVSNPFWYVRKIIVDQLECKFTLQM